ncbi:MAG: RNA polymerase sigma-70 factor [Odoribacteraceae bacterium]|jgi:RNA polymerase sigma-70 factor (ECF subfamily)|nr:RNA polymerase sigma-70 factor [Odoribacteraceae bacterium]
MKEIRIVDDEKTRGEQVQDLFVRYYVALTSFARRFVTAESAEDVVQDIFARLWEERGTMERVENMPAYLYQTVRNRCLNHARDRRSRERQEKAFLEGWEEEEVDGFVEEETFRMLMESIDELPPACRAVLSMGLQGHRAKDIAEKLNIAIATVKKQRQIARRILKQKLGAVLIYAGSLWARVACVFS